MAVQTTTVNKFTFTDATATTGKRTISVPYGKDDLSANDFTGKAAIVAAVYGGFGAFGQAWRETETISSKIYIED